MLYDPVRQIEVEDQPEELVRQKLIRWLKKEFDIPYRAMQVEFGLSFFEKGNLGRLDLLIQKQAKPWMIIECKKPGIVLKEEQKDQIFRYAKVVKPEFVLWTNGNDFHLWQWDGRGIEVSEFPNWK